MTDTIATAGTWDPTDRRIIFLASNPQTMVRGRIPESHRYMLTAVNDLGTDGEVEEVEQLIGEGAVALIDSGVFWLTNKHKRAHGITMDEALGLHPDDIDGFDWLFERYVKIVRQLGEQAWGYIELDQGGMARKRETRKRLHDLGLRPIPVFHPLNDGADYFDELAETHDRICIGNIVQADATTRSHLLHFLAERHRRYPDLWVHVLGMNPDERFHALPVDSADASTWLAPIRWGRFPHATMLDPDIEHMPYVYRYWRQGDPEMRYGVNDEVKALTMASTAIAHTNIGWRAYAAEMDELLDLPMYPDPELG